MELKKLFLERYLPPIVTYLLGLFLLFLYAIIKNISWVELFNSIPSFIWYIFCIIFILWISIIFIRKKMKYPNHPYSVGEPSYGWRNIVKEDYFGVKWQVRTQNPDPLYIDPFRNKIPCIEVDSIPRCPKCETKLNISDDFVYYSWKCAYCGFKKLTWQSNYQIIEEVQNIVDRKVEIANEKSN